MIGPLNVSRRCWPEHVNLLMQIFSPLSRTNLEQARNKTGHMIALEPTQITFNGIVTYPPSAGTQVPSQCQFNCAGQFSRRPVLAGRAGRLVRVNTRLIGELAIAGSPTRRTGGVCLLFAAPTASALVAFWLQSVKIDLGRREPREGETKPRGKERKQSIKVKFSSFCLKRSSCGKANSILVNDCAQGHHRSLDALSSMRVFSIWYYKTTGLKTAGEQLL